ncbi:hypothetical protein KKE19_04100 [Patescibacteria group bacterium]|nr:hypothetical protein [Patescibacteria group bacterium]MBU4578668.1 hypothetical protein [Patescibacteria group bacterium]MCG2701802.1 hypothetical protein [Candidatus Parcubacteria bacterium]
MYKKHPVFEEPSDENSTIWRYLDFTKFVSLLDKKSLWFSKSDKLGDPFEGSFPEVNINLRPSLYKKIPEEIIKKVLPDFYKNVREHTFLNCWHENDCESIAMWNMYLKSNEGIAIRSTYKRLKECLNKTTEDIFIGKVKYIDYKKEWMPEGNSLYPFVHKRKSYEYEKEIRAVIQHFSIDKKTNTVKLALEKVSDGMSVPIEIETLIESVYVSPESPEWFSKLVESVVKEYGFAQIEVIQSSLKDDPVF